MSDQPAMTLRDTIKPNSDQINYDDLLAGPMTVTVTGLGVGSVEQPVIVKIADTATGVPLRDYKPCKSMRRVLIAVWGDNGKDWIGQSMTIYGDSSIKFGGQSVGGIRISHVTGISAPMAIILTTARGKRVEKVIHPLYIPQPNTKDKE